MLIDVLTSLWNAIPLLAGTAGAVVACRAAVLQVRAEQRAAEAEAQAGEQVAETEGRAAERIAEAESRAGGQVAEARACAELRVREAEAPERLLGQAPDVAVRCRVGEIRVEGNTLFIPVWVENRLRSTPIRVEAVNIEALIPLGGNQEEATKLPLRQEAPYEKDLAGLDEWCFVCSGALPESKSPPTPGRIRLITLSGLAGHCVVEGPWGIQRVGIRPIGKRILLPEEP